MSPPLIIYFPTFGQDVMVTDVLGKLEFFFVCHSLSDLQEPLVSSNTIHKNCCDEKKISKTFINFFPIFFLLLRLRSHLLVNDRRTISGLSCDSDCGGKSLSSTLNGLLSYEVDDSIIV